MSYSFLIVDDESDIVEILEYYFRTQFPESKIYTANDGEQALHLSMNETFDLIITDFKMPKMCGDELIKKIRLDSKNPNRSTGILIVTARGDLADMVIEELGGALVIDKPINVKRLLANSRILLSLTRNS